MSPLKTRRLVGCMCGSFLTVAIACLALTAYSGIQEHVYKHDPAKLSSPLDMATLSALCATLRLDSTDLRCRNENAYAFEFYPEVAALYPAPTPRQHVDENIGGYKIGCDAWFESASDGVFQDCLYDFRGDGVYALRVIYRKDYATGESVAEQSDLTGEVHKMEWPVRASDNAYSSTRGR